MLGWLVLLDYWEWLLLYNDALGEVIVHTEDFRDVNMKSKVSLHFDTVDNGLVYCYGYPNQLIQTNTRPVFRASIFF